MSFLSDQVTNPLARFSWGIEPPNSRRRRRAWLAVCLPTALYCLLAGFFIYQLHPRNLYGAGTTSNLIDRQMLRDAVSISLMYGMGGVLLASILVLSFRSRPTRNLRSNWSDYRLAGLTGRQMLRGLSGPVSVGICLVAALHVALFTPFVGLARVSWFLLVMGLAPAFALLPYPFLDVALWVLMPARFARLVAAIAFTFASSPIVFFLIHLTITGNSYLANALVIAEIVSWPVRILIVRWLWLRAIRRLDAPLPAASDSGLRA